jgi:hydrogenase-4 component B
MGFLLLSLALFLIGGLAALAAGREAASRSYALSASRASSIGAASAVAASLTGIIPAAEIAIQAGITGCDNAITMQAVALPMGKFILSLDILSAVFLIPVFILIAIAALYGMGNGDGGKDGFHTGAHWFFYNMFSGGMVLTLTAADAFLFILAWEVMSVAPFFLITMNAHSEGTRSAAWTYLIAAHLGALFLLAFFALLSEAHGGELSFASFQKGDMIGAEINRVVPGGAGVLFLFALIGFGAKSGFMPFHVWLPESHSAVPGHLSSLMSGAMVNMGLYGLIRAVIFIGCGDAWWAYLLIGLGAFSGFMGIILALAQKNIKRSLAFSSVENMGIICMGLGVALLCLQNGHKNAAALAITGSLMHMVNHAFSKGLLFLCAGRVLDGSGSVTLRFLGGLQKRMPLVGWCFVLGSAAISALPPLNGFAGEFFIYLGMVFGGTAFAHGSYPEYSLVFWICLFVLAGIGGFTLLCFTRLYSMAFLGEPRSREAAGTQKAGKNQAISLVTLALICIASALAAPGTAQVCHASLWRVMRLDYRIQSSSAVRTTVPALTAAPENHTPVPHIGPGLTAPAVSGNDGATRLLRDINGVFLLFIVFALGAYLIRKRLLRGKEIAVSPTWDCGYVASTPRMQYSAGSFSRPAAFFMRTLLRQHFGHTPLTEYFPIRAKATLITSDWIITRGFGPLFRLVGRAADVCKHLQHGRSNVYILYILVTLVALLAWQLR